MTLGKMRPSGRQVSVCAALLLSLATSARADFLTAMKAYEARDFATAQLRFMELAELGDGASQFNLGAMALRGEGMDKDMGKAAGWLRAAEQNGYAPDPALLSRLDKALQPEQRATAESIVATYGHAALEKTVLPRAAAACSGLEPSRPLAAITPQYPMNARSLGLDGVVLLTFTVGTDGLASDVQVLGAVPEGYFETEAINAALRSRYSPTTYQGKPVPYRYKFKHSFVITDGGILWDMPAIQKLRSAAESGHPAAQYIIGALASLDSRLEIDEKAARKMVLSAAQGGDPRAQYWMALAAQASLCEPVDRSRVWLEHSATGGNAGARLALARRMIEAGGEEAVRAPAMLASIGDTRDTYVLKHAVALAAGVAGIEFRDAALAAKFARQLDETPKSLDPHREEALAAAFAIDGKFGKAEKLQSRALEMATDLSWNAALIRERLTSYRSRQVWKGDLFVVPPVVDVSPPKGKLGKVTPPE